MIKITDKFLCSGCYACMNVCPKQCIEMYIDREGFWYPSVDQIKCINCHLCERVCPIINKKESDNDISAFACYNKDDHIRLNSSSGGLFTLLASVIINRGGVVYGAMFNEKFEVEHGRINTIEKLHLLRGAKYSQSKLGSTYSRVKEDLQNDIYVYFSGTPCQIDGLLTYLEINYDKLICQDIICHGVPSPNVWKNYLQSFDDDIKEVQFRNKENGWANYEVKIDSENEVYKVHHNNDIYMKAFLSDICLRPSCYKCHSKSLHRNSDITLADFWGIDNIAPEMNDDKGTSLVFINTEKGNELFNIIKKNIVFRKVELDQAVKYNVSAYQSASLSNKRKKFFAKYNGENLEEIVRKLTRIPFIKKIKVCIYRTLKYFYN